MSYRLEAKEPLGAGLKRIAKEQIDQALEQLTAAPEGRDEAVHDARKRFKKVRAVLRLGRDAIGEEVYQAENACYRDAGRLLSPIRTSYVMVETLDEILDRDADELDDSVYQTARKQLAAEHETYKRQLLDHDEALTTVAETIRQARQRVEQWPIDQNDFPAIAPSLKRVYKRGHRGLVQAYTNPNAENFHEWRKRVKYLWYHSRILENLWADLFDELGDQIHDLANTLGEDHDLTELRQLLLSRPDLFTDEEDMEDLIKGLNRRQAELKQFARQLGERIYVEKPKAFVKRMEGYWQAWQADTV